MSQTIAVAGKGGTGKTTLSAMITTSLLRAGKKPVLAVDADPNANLNEALGVEYDRTVVATVDNIMASGADLPAGVPKGRIVEYEVHDALVESRGFDLLVMGRTEGPGCYCYANDLLKGFLDKLSRSYSLVVMDNEAGMEHLSRRTTRAVEVLLVVANPTLPSVRSAARIHQIVQDLRLGVGRSYLVINELNAGRPSEMGLQVKEQIAALAEAGLPLLGEVPYDEDIMRCGVNGEGILDLDAENAALTTVGRLLEELAV